MWWIKLKKYYFPWKTASTIFVVKEHCKLVKRVTEWFIRAPWLIITCLKDMPKSLRCWMARYCIWTSNTEPNKCHSHKPDDVEIGSFCYAVGRILEKGKQFMQNAHCSWTCAQITLSLLCKKESQRGESVNTKQNWPFCFVDVLSLCWL